jgi:hypothetical protein
MDWHDSLLDYLAASNEDSCAIRLFSEVVLSEVRSYRESISWLDVGPGPGTKTVEIYRMLQETGKLARACVLEPSRDWRRFLQARALNGEIQVCPLTLQRYAELERRGDYVPPNLVTLFHVVYSKSLIRTLTHYLAGRCVNEDKLGPATCLVIVESEHSDFCELRRRLVSIGCPVPVSPAERLRNAIRRTNLKFEEYRVDDKRCWVGTREVSKSDWLLPFLTALSIREMARMPQDLVARSVSCVHEFLKERPDGYLCVPDIALKVHFR